MQHPIRSWYLAFRDFIAAQAKGKSVKRMILVRILKLHTAVAPPWEWGRKKSCKPDCVSEVHRSGWQQHRRFSKWWRRSHYACGRVSTTHHRNTTPWMSVIRQRYCQEIPLIFESWTYKVDCGHLGGWTRRVLTIYISCNSRVSIRRSYFKDGV